LICVDASLILRTLVPGPFTDRALALLGEWRRADALLVAPALIAFEVTSVLRRLVYLREITPSHGERAFDTFRKIEIQLSQQQEILPLAWELAKRLNRPRAYDTAYLACAQLNHCEFWTADEKVYNATKDALDWVKWVGDHKPSRPGG
jgi:predicted nucleic acid-binding protein